MIPQDGYESGDYGAHHCLSCALDLHCVISEVQMSQFLLWDIVHLASALRGSGLVVDSENLSRA
jgi:hypothetical protein